MGGVSSRLQGAARGAQVLPEGEVSGFVCTVMWICLHRDVDLSAL